MSRSDSSRPSLASDFVRNPLLVGAIAVLVIGFAVYLSYRANKGLPFVPVYSVQADVANAQELVNGSDVRVGGARVGQLTKVTAMRGAGSHPAHARLQLDLQPRLGPLPADTVVAIRPASILGAKYIDLHIGHSRTTIPAGGVLPLAQSRQTVELSDAFSVFDRGTTLGIRGTVTGLGNALAGRGAAINETIASARQLMSPLQRVLRVVAAPSSDLAGLVAGAASVSHALAGVSGRAGSLVADLGRTLSALDSSRGALGHALDALPPTEDAATATLTRVQPVLADAGALATALRPGIRELPVATPRLAAALDSGVSPLRRLPNFAGHVRDLLSAVDEVSGDPASLGALRALGSTDLPTLGGSALLGLGAVFRIVSDAQFHCNVATLWLRNLASVGANGDAEGAWLDVVPISNPGQSQQSSGPAPDLHLNEYPNENATECEAGNEPFLPGRQLGNPPGAQSNTTLATSPPAGVRRAAAGGAR